MALIFTNNAESVTDTAITAADTVITIADASAFPMPLTEDDYFYVTLSLVVEGTETAWEICKCTNRTTNALVVQRGVDNTVALDWAVGTGIESRLTAAGAGDFLQEGAKGDTGDKGEKGDQGDQGFKGDQGEKLTRYQS